MAPTDTNKGCPESAQKHLEDVRSPLLRSHAREGDPIERQLLLEPAKQVWPEGARYLRKEIAPEDYTGRVENIYDLNKYKQRALQLEHSPTKQLQVKLQGRARQAEAKEIAGEAIARLRHRRAQLERDKVDEKMVELDRSVVYPEISLCQPTDGEVDLG